MTYKIFNNYFFKQSVSKRLVPFIPTDGTKVASPISPIRKSRPAFSFYKEYLFPIQIPDVSSPSLQVPKYFLKGVKGKTPSQISYLLQETFEEEIEEKTPSINSFLEKNLSLKGTLRMRADGLFYLDIDDRFIHLIYPLLKQKGVTKPPYFSLFHIPKGAHSPVILSKESEKKSIDDIPEIGKEITFSLKGIYSIRPDSWPEMEKVWFIKIESKTLEKLRIWNRLPSRIGGHDFHMVIATYPKFGKKRISPTMRINPACYAV